METLSQNEHRRGAGHDSVSEYIYKDADAAMAIAVATVQYGCYCGHDAAAETKTSVLVELYDLRYHCNIQ